MVKNQPKRSKLEEVKFWVAEKCKPREIYRRKYDISGDAFFYKKFVHELAKYGFASIISSRKDSPWKPTENVPGTVVSYKVILTIFWHVTGLITVNFQEKGVTVNIASHFNPKY